MKKHELVQLLLHLFFDPVYCFLCCFNCLKCDKFKQLFNVPSHPIVKTKREEGAKNQLPKSRTPEPKNEK